MESGIAFYTYCIWNRPGSPNILYIIHLPAAKAVSAIHHRVLLSIPPSADTDRGLDVVGVFPSSVARHIGGEFNHIPIYQTFSSDNMVDGYNGLNLLPMQWGAGNTILRSMNISWKMKPRPCCACGKPTPRPKKLTMGIFVCRADHMAAWWPH